MSQDFEFTEQGPPHEPPRPAEPTPPASAPVATPSRPHPAGKPVAARPDPLYRSPISVGAGLLILLALSGGIGYLGVDSYQKAGAAPATPEAPAPDGKDEGNPAPASAAAPSATPEAAPNMDLAGEVEELKASLKSTTARLDEVAAKSAPDLGPVEEKLAAIEKTQGALAGLPARLAALDEKVGAAGKGEPSGDAMTRIEAVDKRVGELAQAVDSIKAEVAAMARPAPQPSATTTAPDDANAADKALSRGAELFLQKKYPESLEVFSRLQADHPEDARVWYFSALANGWATRSWTGETERLVNKGVEREKAGTPEASKIDAAFSGLTVANGKDWLAAYRARAASR